MRKLNAPILAPLAVCILALGLTACNGSDTESSVVTGTTTDEGTTTGTSTDFVVEVDPFNFESDALISSITTQTCTLSNGDEQSTYVCSK